MRLVKCFALSAVVIGILSVHVNAATPVTMPQSKAQEFVEPGDRPVADPAAMNDACPATAEGILPAAGGTINGTTIGMTNDFEDDYPAACGYGNPGQADTIHSFQVDSSGVWNFNTSLVCWDTSLGVRMDSGSGCPGDPVACDGDGANDCYYESSLDIFLNSGVDYFLVVDGYGFGTVGDYGVNYIQTLAACTSDAACDDGDPCNGDETCNTGNGQCEGGTAPCDPAQECVPNPLRAGATCVDPDGCIIYENSAPLGPWSSLSGGTEGTLIADDWTFSTADLGRNLQEYNVVTVGTAANYTVATTLWAHGDLCNGGMSDGLGQCDTDADCTGLLCDDGDQAGNACTVDADCPGNCSITVATTCFIDANCPGGETCEAVGTCPADGTCDAAAFNGRYPNHIGELGGTLCVFPGLPINYFVNLNCIPVGTVLPAEGAWQVLAFIGTGGSAGPALAAQTPEIGSSTDVFAWDTGFVSGAGWGRYWFGGGDLANWVGDVCAEAIGACCNPDLGGACTITTEALCVAGGGTYIGDNNAVTQFDCGADADGDGVADPCDACPNNADFAADQGPCACDSTDTDGDDTGNFACLDCNDACPNEATYCADQGPCNCDPTDSDGDGTLDCVDACPNNAEFAADEGPCQCSSSDTDGDDPGDNSCLDCVDACPDDPNKCADPGSCGCGVAQTDSDGDGVPDCLDQCPGVDDAVFAPECVGKIPTVSEWGLVVLALLLLAAGKVYFGRRKAMA